MKLRNVSRVLILVFACGSVTTSAADDENKAAKQPPAKLPDYSKYTRVIKEMTGEVVHVDEKKITLKVTVTQTAKSPKSPKSGETEKEFTYSFIEESLVRTSFLPLKLDLHFPGFYSDQFASDIRRLAKSINFCVWSAPH